MLDEQILEERDPDMNEEEDIIMEYSRVECCRGVSEDDEDKSKNHALMWGVYTKEKVELIERDVLVSVPHPKGGHTVWTCVKDNTIEEKEEYEAIRLRGFGYKLFE